MAKANSEHITRRTILGTAALLRYASEHEAEDRGRQWYDDWHREALCNPRRGT